MSNSVISVENLSKQYRLGTISHGTLARDIQSWWARLRGRDDPNALLSPETSKSSLGNEVFWALKDVSFDVKQGQVLGIIGRNGAGKSTLLKIFSRVTTPTTGQVKLKGRVASLLEVGTGFHPELTGRENVYLNGAILGMTRKEIDKKFDQITEFAEIEKFIDTPVKRYSSGMYVRLAFAVAAHLEPEILIVDEVLAVGDAQFQKKCLGKMQEVGKEGRTVLFVTHQMAMIRTLCDRAILLNKGQLIDDGNAAEVVERYIKMTTDNIKTSSATFEEDENLAGQILKAALYKKDGKTSTIFDVFEQITLEVDYVLRKPLEGVAINLLVERNGEALFVSFDTDIKPELLGPRKPGRYKTSVVLPNPLKSGQYTVHLSIGRLNVGGVDIRRDALRFEIEEQSFDISKFSGSSTRPGVFPTILDWKNNIEVPFLKEVF